MPDRNGTVRTVDIGLPIIYEYGVVDPGVIYRDPEIKNLPYIPIISPSEEMPFDQGPIITNAGQPPPAIPVPVTIPVTNPVVPGSIESKLPAFLQGDLTLGTLVIPKILAVFILVGAGIYLISKGK